MSQKPQLALISQPQAFFHELVTSALGSLRIRVRPETEFYLVNLLNQFMSADQLFPRDDKGAAQDEPLALLMKDAIEQVQPNAQSAMFRRVGDISLYKAGFFQDSLNRKLVDVDYYIGIGGAAYQQVAVRAGEEVQKSIYRELAQKFSKFVDALAEISDKTAQRTEKDLLRIYELWVRTKSDRAARALQEAGIVPNENIRKDWQ
ncbi:MAG: hypothetical protein A2X94_02635 [Bdellovibrionales bacterium GWB1_55_8]|nr:MAG: hypothetical protein A2X94_02635 [Bdellovibrionales bacterium GWB1_55_8]